MDNAPEEKKTGVVTRLRKIIRIVIGFFPTVLEERDKSGWWWWWWKGGDGGV
jgi:hypothetical protein